MRFERVFEKNKSIIFQKMSSIAEQLIEMGFDTVKAAEAAKVRLIPSSREYFKFPGTTGCGS